MSFIEMFGLPLLDRNDGTEVVTEEMSDRLICQSDLN
jgi:hypothetical protein